MSEYGYICCREMDCAEEDKQALFQLGLKEKQLFIERRGRGRRPGSVYRKLLETLKPGDHLFVPSIIHFGKDVKQMRKAWSEITENRKAEITVLDFPLLDTCSFHDGLEGKAFTEITLQVLDYIIEARRRELHRVQSIGIEKAKAKGVAFGRPKKEKPENFLELATLCQAKVISLREAGRRSGVAANTFASWMQEEFPEKEESEKKGQ